MREAVFNIWAERVAGCRFLDLFAGSGAMGLEALSRGASEVTWVEKQAQAVATIRRNVEELGENLGKATPALRILRLDLARQAPRLAREGVWDLIYADPPYAWGRYPELVAGSGPLLAPGGELAVEHSTRLREQDFTEIPELRVADRRTWGDCAVTFFRRQGSGA